MRMPTHKPKNDNAEPGDIDLEALFGEPFPVLKESFITPATLARQQAEILLFYARAVDRGLAAGGDAGLHRARMAASAIKEIYRDHGPAHARLSTLIFSAKEGQPNTRAEVLARAVIFAFSARWPELAPKLNPASVAAAIDLVGSDGREKKGQGAAAVWKAIAKALAEVGHGVTWQSIRTDYQRRKSDMRKAAAWAMATKGSRPEGGDL